MTLTERRIARRLAPLMEKAESGADWAEICRIEAEMMAAAERNERENDNGQFGVGA